MLTTPAWRAVIPAAMHKMDGRTKREDVESHQETAGITTSCGSRNRKEPIQTQRQGAPDPVNSLPKDA